MTHKSNTAFSADLAAAKSGESAGFEALYYDLEPRVAAFVRARGATDAAGTVNEVFLAVFRGLHSFHGNRPQFNAWVFRIARNKLIDEHRRGSRRIDERLVGDAADLERSHGKHLGSDQLPFQEGIEHHLAPLTPEQREVVLLRVVADLSLAEVAQIMAKPVGAIKALQHRAFRTIARTMSSDGVSP